MSFFEHTQKENRQILVVDDENDNLEFLSDIFSKMGYETVTAASGIKGLNLFKGIMKSEQPPSLKIYFIGSGRKKNIEEKNEITWRKKIL
jgi:response regulator RpfG family c-di-GMP phosphodiesterase